MIRTMTVKDAELRLDQLKNGKIPPKEVPTLANPMYAKAYDGFLRFGTLCNTLREGTDQAGGYLVPDEFEKKIVDALAEKNILRTNCWKTVFSISRISSRRNLLSALVRPKKKPFWMETELESRWVCCAS